MQQLRSRIDGWRGRRLWLLGVGNPEQGDDGFGVRLVARLEPLLHGGAAPIRLLDTGTCPERYVGLAAQAGCQELVFADAVDVRGAPGAAILAGAEELRTRPVGTSTHRVPLAILAQYAEGLGCRAWLLGVQPASLERGRELSPAVAGTLEALVELLRQALGAGGAARGPGPGAGDRRPAATGDGVEP